MAGDANYGDVVLLLHCDGTNGSTTFTDTSPTPKTVTAVGNAKISTAQSKFGSASGYFDGTGDYLTLSSTDFTFTGDFTIEAFVYVAVLPAYFALVECRTAGSFSDFICGLMNVGGVLRPDFVTVGGAGVRLTGTSTSGAVGAWTHVEFSRSSGVLMAFVGGIKDATTKSYAGTITPASGTMRIGSGVDPSYANGYIDDIRITKGVARHTATFTPPAYAHPDAMPVVSGIVRDSSNALCARTVRAYDRTTGALVGSTTSNGTTGAYTLSCSTLNEVSVIALDDVAGTTENDLILRTTPA